MLMMVHWLIPQLCAAAIFSSAIGNVRVAAQDSDEKPLNASSYDYIIVGGGTSGLTVGNRLTESGKRSVLVIEYGYDYLSDDPTILIPIETYRGHPERMYNLTYVPQKGLNGRTGFVAAGAIVGGGSAVNGMTFDRGSAADYDAWEQLGNPGWGWKDMLPYFRKSVTFTEPTKEIAEKYNYTWDHDSAYGGNGPVQIGYPSFQFPAIDMFWKAWGQMGIPKQTEGAGGNAFNAFHEPSALDVKKGTRSYARTAHYDPFKNRTNYHLLTGYQVTEVRFDDNLRATGVNVVKRGTTGPKIALQAERETVVAAGAIWTPWLLQRSGLGPKSVLDEAGIPVLKDFPGVGANFQDHPVGTAVWNLTTNLSPNPTTFLEDRSFMEEARKEYEKTRTGPYTLARGNQAAFLSLKIVNPGWEKVISDMLAQDPKAYLPITYDKKLIDGFIAQRNITASLFERSDNAAVEYAFPGTALNKGSLQRTLSRGTININPSNPLAQPLIDYQTLVNPIDVTNAIAMVKYARTVMQQDAVRSLGPVELVPGKNITSDEGLEKSIRERLMDPSFAHPSGTASMLPEEYGGVVSPELLVYHTKGLSVVDASVMPLIPATHLSTTVYAVAEKAADIIKKRTNWE